MGVGDVSGLLLVKLLQGATLRQRWQCDCSVYEIMIAMEKRCGNTNCGNWRHRIMCAAGAPFQRNTALNYAGVALRLPGLQIRRPVQASAAGQ